MADFENAKDKVMLGVERRSLVLTPEQKEKTAYHDAGHAVVGLSLPKCDPVYKATIIPRGGALGMVVSLPEMDRLNFHKDEAKQKIADDHGRQGRRDHQYGRRRLERPRWRHPAGQSAGPAMVMRGACRQGRRGWIVPRRMEGYTTAAPRLGARPRPRN